jgi:hypothetical protein
LQPGETFAQPHQGLKVWCVHSIDESFAMASRPGVYAFR